MARRRRVGGVLCLLLAALTACTPQPKSETRRETTRYLPTIVSLNPCADAILAEVTAPGQLLALSHYSADPRAASMDPAKARQFPTTRGTLEEVLTLRPDVVVDSTFVPPATAAAYRRLGLRLETIGIASTVEESRAQIRGLAAMAGNPAQGEALIARIDAALAAAAPTRAGALPALVWEPGGIVPGDNTLIANLLRRTGFANFAAARGLGQADQLPLERVLADPPRVILVAGSDRALSHPALTHLTGTTRAALDPRLLYCAGPTIIPAAQRLAEVRRTLSPLPIFAAGTNGEVAREARRRGSSPLPLAGGAGGGSVPPKLIASQ
ncbi:ABC transporter substrate-binding protein [Novosphingobium sp.]|uniref:ABC transporter substrate-binding protein n=1 Tax=Novosphingobium sp. TaxID=1874826 RepID=UPI002627A566|nr:ABC transporter substrate-binding protein [Novosphingobium sp.]